MVTRHIGAITNPDLDFLSSGGSAMDPKRYFPHVKSIERHIRLQIESAPRGTLRDGDGTRSTMNRRRICKIKSGIP